MSLERVQQAIAYYTEYPELGVVAMDDPAALRAAFGDLSVAEREQVEAHLRQTLAAYAAAVPQEHAPVNPHPRGADSGAVPNDPPDGASAFNTGDHAGHPVGHTPDTGPDVGISGTWDHVNGPGDVVHHAPDSVAGAWSGTSEGSEDFRTPTQVAPHAAGDGMLTTATGFPDNSVSPSEPYHPETHGPFHPAQHGDFHPEVHGAFHPQVHGDFHPDMHGAFHPQVHGDFHPDMHGAFHPQVHGDFHPDMHGAFHPQVHGDFHPDMHGAFHPQVHGDFHPDMHGAFHPQVHGDFHPDMHGAFHPQVHGDFHPDMHGPLDPERHGEYDPAVHGESNAPHPG